MKSNQVACGSIRAPSAALASPVLPRRPEAEQEDRHARTPRSRARTAIASSFATRIGDEHQSEQHHGLGQQQERQAARDAPAPARAWATMRVASRTSTQKSTQASSAPTPAATAPLVAPEQRGQAGDRDARATRFDALNSSRPPLPPGWSSWRRFVVFVSRGFALVRRCVTRQERLDGGADSEEQTEVHDPVCVRICGRGSIRRRPPMTMAQGNLDSERAGRCRRRATFFCCLGRWRGVPVTCRGRKIKPGCKALRDCPAPRGPRAPRWRRSAILHRVRQRQERRLELRRRQHEAAFQHAVEELGVRARCPTSWRVAQIDDLLGREEQGERRADAAARAP